MLLRCFKSHCNASTKAYKHIVLNFTVMPVQDLEYHCNASTLS